MGQDREEEVREYHFDHMTVKVIRPELTEEEYRRRHRELERAAEHLLRSVERGNRETSSGRHM